MRPACVVYVDGRRARATLDPDADPALVAAAVISVCASRGVSVAAILETVAQLRLGDVEEAPPPYIVTADAE